MPSRHIAAPVVPALIQPGLKRLRSELEVPEGFPPEVLAAAEVAAKAPSAADRVDRTDLELVTIDPEGSMDLDQAVHIAKNGCGYLVHYTIAEVGPWVAPGGAVDAETHRRGQTFYAPDQRAALHPPALSASAASLLADGKPRPALLWPVPPAAAGG